MRMGQDHMLKIISANGLADGVVVYFIAAGLWTKEIAKAKTFASEEELEAGIALAKTDEKHHLIVDPFDVEVNASDTGALEAKSLRNAIRAAGPTIDFLPHTAS